MSEGREIVNKALKKLFAYDHTKEALKLPTKDYLKISKFEGWLKIELANQLSKNDRDVIIEKIELEPHYFDDDFRRGDISFISKKDGKIFFIELKTIRNYVKDNENFTSSDKNYGNKRRRTLKDVESVKRDIEKIRAFKNNPDKNGIVAFIIFPVREKTKNDDIKQILNKIERSLNADEILEQHYTPLNEKNGFVYGIIDRF